MRQHDLARRGIEDIHGVTLGDFAELAKHLSPNVSVWWSTLPELFRSRFRSFLNEQFPRIAALDLSKVTSANFLDWMRVQEIEFGPKLLVAQLKAEELARIKEVG